MRKIEKKAAKSLRYAIVIAALTLSGCSIFAPAPEPFQPVWLPEPATTAEPQPEIVILPPEPEPEPVTPVRIPEPVELPAVAILLSSNLPAYADVAEALTREFEEYQLFDLSDRSRPAVSVLRTINDSESGAVVAVGLRAAQSAVAMADKPVVFSQVFNFQDYDLLADDTRGIAALPPVDGQLAAWKDIDASITRVGAIIGPGHDELIATAEVAALRHGIDLNIQVTHSDQETLYFFKRMIRDIDGFWLLPDNRVLSRRALQTIMDDAQRLQVPVMASSESMLQIGASVSVTSVASDIANVITQVVREIQAGKLNSIPMMTPLTEIRVRTVDENRVVER